jgi:hypothetical protein
MMMVMMVVVVVVAPPVVVMVVMAILSDLETRPGLVVGLIDGRKRDLGIRYRI